MRLVGHLGADLAPDHRVHRRRRPGQVRADS